MTASTYLRVRADMAGEIARTFEIQAANPGNCDIERDAYNKAVSLMDDIQFEFIRAADELDERAGLRLSFRRVVPRVPASQSEGV